MGYGTSIPDLLNKVDKFKKGGSYGAKGHYEPAVSSFSPLGPRKSYADADQFLVV